jgi:hypothetical protein
MSCLYFPQVNACDYEDITLRAKVTDEKGETVWHPF